MAVSYLRRGMTGPATFSLIAAGLEDCLAFLADFSFTADHLGSAPRWGFSADAPLPRGRRLQAHRVRRPTGDEAIPQQSDLARRQTSPSQTRR